ncbi:MAG: hypothetical protein WA634_11485, partial [Silvibacterium sp.]
MIRNRGCTFLLFVISLVSAGPVIAQGTLADYQRAQRFLPGNVRHLVLGAGLASWIGKGDSFWYLENTVAGKQFIVVDAAKNTIRPAFDHARLAAA